MFFFLSKSSLQNLESLLECNMRTSKIISLSSVHFFFLTSFSPSLTLVRPPAFAPEPTRKHTQSVTKQTVGTPSPQPVPHTLTALSQAAGTGYIWLGWWTGAHSVRWQKEALPIGWLRPAPGLERCDWLLLRLLKEESLSIPDYCSGRSRAGLLHSVSPNTNHCERERGEREREEQKKLFSCCG